MIKKFDEYCIQKMQELYLWFFDWTGIYVATIATMTVIFNGGMYIIYGSLDFRSWQAALLVVNILILIPYYLDQDKKNFTAFNYRAGLMRESLIRIVLQFFLLGGLGSSIIVWSWMGIINAVSMSLYLNIVSIYIRDREPKEWFKPKLAMQEHR